MNIKLFSKVAAAMLLVAACTPATTTEEATTYTMDEISQHSTAEDCWHLIDGKVYDVTDYLESHPAGAGPMTRFCGQDATEAYEGISGGNGHSETADQIADDYYLGDLAE